MSTPPTTNILKMMTRPKKKSFRVAILGQNGVGKSALTVRFITRRFIGDYDPEMERVYSCNKTVLGCNVDFEILDTAEQHENNKLEENIRWADAFILMYSVTDRCSFNECLRLRFLINSYCKKRRPLRMISDPTSKTRIKVTTPVVLVANQIDRLYDRMVTYEEGIRNACELSCVGFYEISVPEMIDRVTEVFCDLYASFKTKKTPILKKSKSFRIDRSSNRSTAVEEEEDQIADLPNSQIYNPTRRLGI